MDLIKKIEKAGLLGRGGAEFPVAKKWQSVLATKRKQKNCPVYVVVNATEGEPGVAKDKHIIRKYPEELMTGVKLAAKTFGAKKTYFYCQKKNLAEFKRRLKPLAKGLAIEFFPENGGYICGEETTLLETIEGNRSEPRLKPPYPTERGLFGCPTLVNNVETFFYVARIARGKYQGERFYSIGGDVRRPGVFELPSSLSIGEVLKKTGNEPKGDYFIQAGGGAAGEILLPSELKRPLKGAGSLIIHDIKKTAPMDLLRQWIEFFYHGNCGKCAPCREGLYRLREILGEKQINWAFLRAICETMREASFCPLGRSVFTPVVGLLEKVGVRKK